MIKLDKISKVYENGNLAVQALTNVSFEIKKGEFVAIMGPSGSGKSTLMHILGLLDTPTSGDYYLNNNKVGKLNEDRLSEIRNREIGFVFQAYNLLPKTSSLKNVMLPMMYAGINKNERLNTAKNVLKLVGLEDKMESYSSQLSGGQKQRVAIARALSMSPSIILADEPTGNLPSKQGQEIMNIFESLNKQGNTIIVITHEDFIANRTNRIITLADGKILSDRKHTI